MDPLLTNALRHLQTGALREAEAACRSVLARNERNPEALQLLGIVRRQQGDLAQAETLLRRSVELLPRNAEFRTNLAQLLSVRGALQDSAGEYERALELDPKFRPALLGLARLSNRLCQPARAEKLARRLIAANQQDADAWSALGAALHGASRLGEARAALERAAALAPKQGPIRAQLAATLCDEERAELALAQIEAAARLGVATRGLALTRARALMQLDQYDAAEVTLTPLVMNDPHDIETQFLLAQLRHVRGDEDFARSLREASVRPGAPPQTVAAYADVLRRAGDGDAAEQMLRGLLARSGAQPQVAGLLGMILQEIGRYAEAVDLTRQAANALPDDAAAAENYVAAALSAGEPRSALATIERFRAATPDDQRWITYRADVARQTGEGLFDLWCDLERVVRVYELEPPAGYASLEDFHGVLKPALQARHRQLSHPLDQSLRHGTQTSRGLLADPGPAIRAFLEALAGPIADYQTAMARDTAHPLYARNSGPAQLTGCWSVQLKRGGFHVNHIHPQGWISSAYYVAVPAEVQDTTLRSGWIKFGEPRFAMPHGEAGRFVQPQPGRLVLFPSYLWHGTTPIHGDEPRLAIAFDAVPGIS